MKFKFLGSLGQKVQIRRGRKFGTYLDKFVHLRKCKYLVKEVYEGTFLSARNSMVTFDLVSSSSGGVLTTAHWCEGQVDVTLQSETCFLFHLGTDLR